MSLTLDITLSFSPIKTGDMKIACIGWGSLIWDPQSLKVLQPWHSDGPMFPLEFARQSLDGRLTLVIVKETPLVQTLWARMNCSDIDEARQSLLDREKIPKKSATAIGTLVIGKEGTTANLPLLQEWTQSKNLDAVVWTNLPPKFGGTIGRTPNLTEALAYLQSMELNQQKRAEEYVRNAHPQIVTPFRTAFQSVLKWT